MAQQDEPGDNRPYVRFAEIYDSVMRPVGYEMWAEYIEELCRRFEHAPRRVLDLACGTGNTSLPFARRGYVVTGADRSATMLAVARQKAVTAGLSIDFVEGDMRSFHIAEPVDLAVCLFDSINYLLEESDVAAAARAVRDALVPGGLFIFDANTPYRLAQVDDEVLVFEEDDYCLVWRNSYDPRGGIWRADLTGFLRDDGEDRFVRFRETHEERGYGPAELQWACEQGGLEVLGMYTAFGFEPVAGDSTRVYVVARRPAEDSGRAAAEARLG